MARQLYGLYRYLKERDRDTRKVTESWKQMDKAQNDVIPVQDRGKFNLLLVQHSEKMEYQGFVKGFRLATLIWKEGCQDVF
ncbi:MAG: hypothetical protein ACOX8E_12380 [Ruminococcus sp.]|jgi:hypothetical protein